MITKRMQQPDSSFDSLVPLSSWSSPFRLKDENDVKVVKAVLEELAKEAPAKGLGGFSERFGRAGLKNVFNGWITAHSYTPVRPDSLETLMGEDYLGKLQQATGIGDSGDLQERLARVLPQVIHYLTPIGEIPSNRLLAHNIHSLLVQLP